MRKKIGTCPRCFKTGYLETHHWLPRRFFGNTHKMILLCPKCHAEIEIILPLSRKLKKSEYEKIHIAFMAKQDVIVKGKIHRVKQNGLQSVTKHITPRIRRVQNGYCN